MENLSERSLLRLLQLSSSTLPVGAYAFSSGLESAVERGWVDDSKTTIDWLSLQLTESLVKTDLPILLRQLRAIEEQDVQGVAYWNDYLLACRETAELRLSDTSTGLALMTLLKQLSVSLTVFDGLGEKPEVSFVSVFATACHYWGIDEQSACYGFLWSWLDNQVAAAIKLVPLGQVAAQKALDHLLPSLPERVEESLNICDAEIGSSLPALAMVSSWHESQYSRLFRS